jgi:hypothetical protein
MAGSSPEERVELVRRGFQAVRDGLCAHLAILPSFEAAMAAAREREGLTVSEDGE